MGSILMITFALVAGHTAPALGPGAENVDTNQWLAVLGVPPGTGTGHTRERLVIVTPDGRIARVVEGQAGRVNIPLALELWLARPGSDLTMVHNHPEGNGLSPNDLAYLEYPGVRAVVAIGHDGSVYMASRGPRFPSGALVGTGKNGEVYGAAHTRARRVLAFERDPASRVAFDAHMYHLLSAALASADVLHYQAQLGAARQTSFLAATPLLTRVHNAALAGSIAAAARR